MSTRKPRLRRAVRLVFDRLKSTGSTNAIELGPPA
jgi:hypothetical protein